MSESAETEEKRAAPETQPETPAETSRPRALALPEGWLGILLLFVLAALSGGLVAAYWPSVFTSADNGIGEDRIAALEARVGQLAAGRSNAAATGVFDDLRRNLTTLSDRLDADEARLTALEKGTPAPTAESGQPGGATDITAMRTQLSEAAAAITQLGQRVAKLEANSASGAQIADAIAKFAALQARVAALDADIARTAETHKGTMDAVNTRLAAIEAALPPELATRLDELAPRTDVEVVAGRVERLEAMNAGDVLHRAAALLALASLAHASSEGTPFVLELEALAAAAPGDPSIAALRPWAASGVPTSAILRAQFAPAARRALDVHRTSNAQDFFSRLWSNIEGLISVRRVGEVEGSDLDARIARAGLRVNVNDLAGAVNEVAAIRGPAAAPFAQWLRNARARVALDRTIAQINARVVRGLAAQAPAPAPAAILAVPAGEPPVAPAPERPPVPSHKP